MSTRIWMVNEISEDVNIYDPNNEIIYYSDDESIVSDGDSSINSHFTDIQFSISDDIWKLSLKTSKKPRPLFKYFRI